MDIRHVSRDERDKLLSPSRWSKRGDANKTINLFCENMTSQSNKMLEHCRGRHKMIKYGDTEKQTLNIFYPPSSSLDTSLCVILHGGMWTETGPKHYLHLGMPFVNNGYIAVVVGYDQAPQVDMTTIVNEVNCAFDEIMELFPFAKHITMVGYSAGSQLACCLLLRPKFEARISSFISISGVFELDTLLNSYVDQPLKLTKTEIEAYSPHNNLSEISTTLSKNKCKVTVVTAEYDTPEFTRQSDAFFEDLLKLNIKSKRLTIHGVDHFNILEEVGKENFELNKVLLN